jgi:serine/threonine protein kinase
VRAISYLHDLDITHSDIKLENIVLSELKKDQFSTLKLTDDGKAPSFGQKTASIASRNT